MTLLSLHLQDFRNYQDRTFDLSRPMTAFVGANGRGKTNILEAIHVMALGKSWRETGLVDLVRDQTPSAKITLQTKEGHYQALLCPPHRQFFHDEKKIPLKHHIGSIPVLLFCPEHLALFRGSKKLRLEMLDRFISQMSEDFRDALFTATKAHRHKTALLRQKDLPSPEVLQPLVQPWNHLLCQSMPIVLSHRQKMLAQWKPHLEQAYQEISDRSEPLDLLLETGIEASGDLSSEEAKAFLEAQWITEYHSRRNSFSPLRSDVHFFLREAPITHSASRGEERSMLLSLLKAQKEIYQEAHHKSPILLLDDVFSELDDDRQKHLLSLCQDTQTVFTTTHAEHVKGIEVNVVSL